MQSRLWALAVVAVALAASSGCAHRTTTVSRTSEMTRTETGRQEVAPPPLVEDSTTVIKRSHMRTEEGQQ